MNNINNTLTWTGQKEWERWTGSNKCPMCGGDDIEYNTTLVLTSNPPQSQLRCKSCGHYFSSGYTAEWTNNDALNKLWGHDQSILGTPKVGDWPPSPQPGDWPPSPIPCDPPSTLNYGWICPKCGKVNAPHRDFCDCSGGGYYPNIVYCNGTGNNPNPVPTVTISDNALNKATSNSGDIATYSFEACNLHTNKPPEPNPPRITPITLTENFSLREEKDLENKYNKENKND